MGGRESSGPQRSEGEQELNIEWLINQARCSEILHEQEAYSSTA
jgi:hypothetical protein